LAGSGVGSVSVTGDERWLAAVWPFVRDSLPAAPDGLDARFDSQLATYGPYFFPDLAGTSEADEQAAIDSGLIQANRIQYVGRRRSHTPAPSA